MGKYEENEFNRRLGDAIREARENVNMTQTEFAEKLEITRASLGAYETGSHPAPVAVLLKVSQITGKDINELVNPTAKNRVIVDTNIILNCPNMVKILPTVFDKVYIPDLVIDELDGLSHDKSTQKRALSSICTGNILAERKNSDKIEIVVCQEKEGKVDDRIFACAIQIAKNHSADKIYLFTNDKYFNFKDSSKVLNLKVIGTNEYDTLFRTITNSNPVQSKNFFMAIKNKELGKANELLNKNIDVNYIDSKAGFTPLIQAIRNRDYKTFCFLIGIPQIDLNAVDNWKHNIPPISHAIQINHKKMVEVLIENGADVNEPSRNSKNSYNTPLMIAAWSGQLELVELLVENGACVNQQDKGNGFTPLIKAVFNNHPETVKYLLQHGADKSIYSYEKKRAIDYAYDKNAGGIYKEIIELLNGDNND